MVFPFCSVFFLIFMFCWLVGLCFCSLLFCIFILPLLLWCVRHEEQPKYKIVQTNWIITMWMFFYWLKPMIFSTQKYPCPLLSLFPEDNQWTDSWHRSLSCLLLNMSEINITFHNTTVLHLWSSSCCYIGVVYLLYYTYYCSVWVYHNLAILLFMGDGIISSFYPLKITHLWTLLDMVLGIHFHMFFCVKTPS